jgi:hypothetical protein
MSKHASPQETERDPLVDCPRLCLFVWIFHEVAIELCCTEHASDSISHLPV